MTIVWNGRPCAVAAGLILPVLLSGEVAWAQSGAASASAPLSLPQASAIFGARETIESSSLSPDGAMLALVEPYGARGSVLKILDLSVPDGRAKGIVKVDGNPDRIEWCRWSGHRRLLCQVYGMAQVEGNMTYLSRLMAMDVDGNNIQELRTPRRNGWSLGYNLYGGSVIDWNTGKDGHILMSRGYVPEFSTGTRLAQNEEGLGVDDIDTSNLKVARKERPRAVNQEFISDGQGRVRVMAYDPQQTYEGYASGKIRYVYRTKDKDDWLPLNDYDIRAEEGFNPHRVDPTLDVAYGLKKVNGRFAAFSRSLDGKNNEQLLLARPDVDVDGFITMGRSQRVIGVTYTTDRREVVYVDPALQRLAASLAKAIPDLPLIRIVDSSQDEKKLLIWAGSDKHPGVYYLLDRDSRGMTEIAYSRAPLATRKLATVSSVQVKAADGTSIPAYLTLPAGSNGKNLPAIVMPHGGPSARDDWGFDWLAQFWADRGYAVLQPNFRGSSGYGDQWFQNNGFQSWRVAIGDVADSGKWLVDQGIADLKRLAVFGWSYGGYAALQSAATRPEMFRAVIAVAPVTDLARLKEERINYGSYRITRDFIGVGPHIEEGSPLRQADKINVPVLMFHGDYDVNVGVTQSRLMAERLRAAGKNGRLVTYEKLDHYLEDSAVRMDMLSQSATFLEQSFVATAK